MTETRAKPRCHPDLLARSRVAAAAPSSSVFVALALLVFGAPTGCSTKACTTRGCQDQFVATVAGQGGAFPSGMHQIDVTVDGAALSCTFTFPLPSVGGGGTQSPSCTTGLTVDVFPATTCTSHDADGASTLSCDPIPGQFVETITVAGKPVQVTVRQSVDGTNLLDETVTASYQTNQPNGPECPPFCQQAVESWTLAQAGSGT